ncbi:MOSC domain containing protein [Thermodesulfobium narugense DSM 14796]|uniref:MOSC domain containing protein n=1 Tax=Thermodesulfobium narugense DSM 14796 TaxID=747365 RepID=M1E8N2_9BACT|nr:MOSC domain-containing protein [Thermodesulfobium narugense]AEE15055.1 MOSC domain containing protein [Thermodesulfobium narugense DSM 14796]
MKGKVVNCAISTERGVPKSSVQCIELIENYGAVGDAHAGLSQRQISVSSLSTYSKGIAKELNLKPGDYADNITVEGIDVYKMGIGTKFKIGQEAILQIVEIGKGPNEHLEKSRYLQFNRPHNQMLKEGVFCKVLKGGKVCVGDIVDFDI